MPKEKLIRRWNVSAIVAAAPSLQPADLGRQACSARLTYAGLELAAWSG